MTSEQELNDTCMWDGFEMLWLETPYLWFCSYLRISPEKKLKINFIKWAWNRANLELIPRYFGPNPVPLLLTQFWGLWRKMWQAHSFLRFWNNATFLIFTPRLLAKQTKEKVFACKLLKTQKSWALRHTCNLWLFVKHARHNSNTCGVAV